MTDAEAKSNALELLTPVLGEHWICRPESPGFAWAPDMWFEVIGVGSCWVKVCDSFGCRNTYLFLDFLEIAQRDSR